MQSFFIIFIVFLSIWANKLVHHSNACVFTLKMHHRFSDPVKKWSEGINKFTPGDFPAKGSVEYYSQLANHDKIFRGRRLSDSGEQRLTFSDGNSSFRISSLGFLHYTTVSLGTPGQKFMVALDTGSDLFWVPCDCSRCASIDNTAYSSEFKLSIYSPTGSSTSKKITCNHSMCTHRHECPGSEAFNTCPYSVSYVSSQTSTSGILMEDLLHLETEDSNGQIIDAFVTFGCGQVQSGSFLDIAAPNGLFGLGFEKISVPSILSREGYTADSFSMCFGHDGTGRISFGDKGSLDQELRVGSSLIDSCFTALFDSGTSFTYLVDPHYTRLTQRFHAQTKDSRHPTDQRIPFEYCYDMSPNANTSLIPSMSLTMKGEGQFFIYDPVIVISTNREVVYCLAVIRSAELNIIGQNFMTGYRIVFDREELVLGWKKSDCYDIEISSDSRTTPLNPNNVPPAVAAGLQGRTQTTARTSVGSPFYTRSLVLEKNPDGSYTIFVDGLNSILNSK
ncbi:Aspartic peptidase [Cynara cardunculus var. scolymus]|uniref:Aspartic peptidase n=1 Tax=Cynara cardunculus var. scolymus TaxID=59895 RepID=A0A103XKF9_CYNCS|nr:Aspartic peptidase [Cynara cardunculus var. scolymus]